MIGGWTWDRRRREMRADLGWGGTVGPWEFRGLYLEDIVLGIALNFGKNGGFGLFCFWVWDW